MSQFGRYVRIGVALGLSLWLPSVACAGDLRTPTIAASAAAAADWASTYHALKNYRVREMNPVLRPFDHRPGAMISLGSAIDMGLISVWNLSVGPKHENLASAGLWTMAAFRAYLAIHNVKNETRAARR